MGLLRYNKSILELRLAQQRAEEENLRRQAQLNAQTQAAGLAVVPALVQGGLQVAQGFQNYNKDRMNYMSELAKSAIPGSSGGVSNSGVIQETPEPMPVGAPDAEIDAVAPAVAQVNNIPFSPPPITPEDQAAAAPGQTPAFNSNVPNALNAPNALQQQNDMQQKNELTTPAATANPAQAPAAAEPATPAIEQKPAPKPVEAAAEKTKEKGFQYTKAKATSPTYEPIQWDNSVEDEAKQQVDEILKSNEPSVFMNIITLGSARGDYNMARNLAEKQAAKAIYTARQQAEQQAFAEWAKNKEVQFAERRLIADEELKAAQAYKATQGNLHIRMTGNVLQDMRTGSSALRGLQTVNTMFNDLVKAGGDGLPLSEEKQKMIAMIQAASADVDSSAAGIGAAGLSAGINLNQTTGKYVDDKIITETINSLDKLNMTPKQREFAREMLLTAQQIGKSREGGRMTDNDLKFYVDALFSSEDPDSFAATMQRRADEVKRDYAQIYGVHAGNYPDIRDNFENPQQFNFNFRLDNPQERGYASQDEFNKAKAEWRLKAAERVRKASESIKGAKEYAGNLGYKRNSSPVGLAEQSYDQVKDILTGKKGKGGDQPKPKKPKPKI